MSPSRWTLRRSRGPCLSLLAQTWRNWVRTRPNQCTRDSGPDAFRRWNIEKLTLCRRATEQRLKCSNVNKNVPYCIRPHLHRLLQPDVPCSWALRAPVAHLKDKRDALKRCICFNTIHKYITCQSLSQYTLAPSQNIYNSSQTVQLHFM